MTTEDFADTVSDDDPAFDTSVAHQARFYNYLIGGKDHFAADRDYAESLLTVYPGLAATARANRAFLWRSVRFLAGEAGLSQFLDIGTGIPAPGSTHETAQEVRPDSRVVYVDNDPVVLAHARAFLVGRAPGSTDYLDADLHDPGRILAESARTLDFSRPVGLLLVAILHAFSDAEDPYGIVATLLDALPAGSYLALTHWGPDPASPDADARVGELTRQRSRQQYTPRDYDAVARFFDGLELAEPGLVQVQEWRAPGKQDTGGQPVWWAGVARKP